jgi:uncharacterized protein YjbI with pentapeptide repeats
VGNPDHIQILGRGAEALRQWRRANPQQYLDCSGAVLQNTTFTDVDLTAIDFSNADLTGSNLQRATLVGGHLAGVNLSNAMLALANLERADLSNSNLEGANLSQANLTNAILTTANLRRAVLHQAALINALVTDAELDQANLIKARLDGVNLRAARLAGAILQEVNLPQVNLSDCDLTSTSFVSATLSGTRFSKARLGTANFASSDLTCAIFDDADLAGADLRGADLRGANVNRPSFVRTSLRRANLRAAKLTNAYFRGADFFESEVSIADFERSRGLTDAKNLHSVRVTSGDALNFDTILVPFLQRLISWERIRFLGRLPLFGASYAALAAIPIFFYLLDFFNRKVDVIRVWASQEAADGGVATIAAKAILEHFHREAIPSLSLVLFVSTILLGAGATTSRIREFSRDQWCDEINHSLIHYWPYSWQHLRLRLLCVVFYGFGGIGVMFVLISKLWNVFWFIVDNS